MRLVNNVEREMMRAEWENWLLDENTRCKQVQMMLRENVTNISPTQRIKGADPQQVPDMKERDRLSKRENLKRWQEEYCGSCQQEQELLFEGRQRLSSR
jgi:hypothetical protein